MAKGMFPASHNLPVKPFLKETVMSRNAIIGLCVLVVVMAIIVITSIRGCGGTATRAQQAPSANAVTSNEQVLKELAETREALRKAEEAIQNMDHEGAISTAIKSGKNVSIKVGEPANIAEASEQARKDLNAQASAIAGQTGPVAEKPDTLPSPEVIMLQDELGRKEKALEEAEEGALSSAAWGNSDMAKANQIQASLLKREIQQIKKKMQKAAQ
jgi:hypothetical protein